MVGRDDKKVIASMFVSAIHESESNYAPYEDLLGQLGLQELIAAASEKYKEEFGTKEVLRDLLKLRCAWHDFRKRKVATFEDFLKQTSKNIYRHFKVEALSTDAKKQLFAFVLFGDMKTLIGSISSRELRQASSSFSKLKSSSTVMLEYAVSGPDFLNMVLDKFVFKNQAILNSVTKTQDKIVNFVAFQKIL